MRVVLVERALTIDVDPSAPMLFPVGLGRDGCELMMDQWMLDGADYPGRV